MIKRNCEDKLRSLAKSFPAIAVTGPRQSGKTTVVKKVFPDKPYVNLEDPDTRRYAQDDPRGFLSRYPNGAVLDEVQRVPDLFSYLQGILDEKNEPGLFILTGSQNFLLMENITQSLAGRIALLNLLPFSLEELSGAGIMFGSFEEYAIRGFYPRVYDKDIKPRDLYSNYVSTYLERDLRSLKNIQDLHVFHTFLKLCAHRNGQLINLSSLATDCGITHNTAKSWLSVLETSFIIFFLRPYYKNYNKRLVKMPKMYFWDTGLASYLADIEDQKHLCYHPLRGVLFESLIIAEFFKKKYNIGEIPQLYFWRDKNGHEIDCIIDRGDRGALSIEMKSGKTIAPDFFDQLKHFQRLTKAGSQDSYVIYAGDQIQTHNSAQVVPWNQTKILDPKYLS